MVTRRSVVVAGLLGAAAAPVRAEASPNAGPAGRARDTAGTENDGFIKGLIGQMTLEEKVGQLTMSSAHLTETGPVSAPLTLDSIKQGRVGSLLNMWGVDRVRELQRIAVEETRLKIPLFFGFDVLHGHRTIFPIPVARPAPSTRSSGSRRHGPRPRRRPATGST